MLLAEEILIDEVANLLDIDQSKIEHLPSGGQKQVFLVTDNNDKVVIKFVQNTFKTAGSPTFNKYESIIKRTLRELELMRDYSSSNLPVLNNIVYEEEYSSNGAKFIVFAEDFVGNKSVRDIIAENSGDQNEAIKILKDISSAVSIYWKQGKIIHRDIKPENIIKSDSDGQYVLIDSGIHFSPLNTSITAGIIGTPPYLSPEQALGERKELDCRSDLYCLGLVAYEVITGKHPYFDLETISGMSEDELRDIIVNTKPKAFGEYEGLEIEEWLAELVHSLLSKRKFYRPRNPDKLIKLIEGAMR